MKVTNVIIFQTINRGVHIAANIGLFRLNVVVNSKMFSFDRFLDFREYFCGIARTFRSPCFISKSG